MKAVSWILLVAALGSATAGSWWMSTAGVGLADAWSQTVSVRSGSAGAGRTVVGGGLRGGK